jgi:hypothetical protein
VFGPLGDGADGLPCVGTEVRACGDADWGEPCEGGEPREEGDALDAEGGDWLLLSASSFLPINTACLNVDEGFRVCGGDCLAWAVAGPIDEDDPLDLIPCSPCALLPGRLVVASACIAPGPGAPWPVNVDNHACIGEAP